VRVRFTPTAREQFLAVVAYIQRDDRAAARRFRQRAERALRRLERFPESGRHLSEFPDLPHREVVVRPYRFFYRVHGRTAWVVSVWHSAQLAQLPHE
jgi:plasmid stabilization system protein ParE